MPLHPPPPSLRARTALLRPAPGRHSVRASSAAQTVGLLLGSAVPFVAIQALADSPAGQQLKQRVEAELPRLQRQAAADEAARSAARARSPFFGADRFVWPGPPAPWLQGEVAGDYGWDPLGLAADKEGVQSGRSQPSRSADCRSKQPRSATRRPPPSPPLDAARFERYVELELLHARWAMLGALGAVVPEALALTHLSSFSEDRWFMVGRAKLSGEDLNYFGVPGLRIAGGEGVAIIAVAQALLMSGPEIARAAGPASLQPVGIFLPGDQNYPGGALFDPLGLASDPDAALRLRVAEIKHGRLAMVAFVGFAAQAATGRSEGPLRDVVAWIGG